MTNPKSVGKLPLTSCQESPASSLRITSQCFCMNSTFGRDGMHGDVMNAVADFGVRVGNVLRLQTAVDRLPGLAAVVGAKRARSRDGDVDAVGIARIENDGVQAHAAGARLPARARAVAAQAGKFLPGLAAVGGAEQRGVFHSGVNGVGIGERRLEMPDALELPGMLRAVVPLVRGERLAGFGRSVVDELVALAFGDLARAGFARGRCRACARFCRRRRSAE